MPRPDRFAACGSTRTSPPTAAPLAALALCTLWGTPVHATETLVEPGTETLAAAIAAASPGDTLLLQDGTYAGDANVDRALTVRAINRAATAIVSGSVRVAAPGAPVTIQGLHLTQNLTIERAADVKVLENDLYNGNIILAAWSDPYPSESPAPDSEHLIIGNRLHYRGSISDQQSGHFYIAGNTLDSGQIYSTRPGWVVGNQVTSGSGSSSDYSYRYGYGVVYYASIELASDDVRCIGNRVDYYSYPNSDWYYGGSYYIWYRIGIWVGPTVAMSALASKSLVANNLVDAAGTQRDSAIKVEQQGISSVVNNNLVDGHWSSDSSFTAIFGGLGARVAGNIAWGGAIYSGNLYSPGEVDARYNLCFPAAFDCGALALSVDPQFSGLGNWYSYYRLAPTSPAINAGPPDPALSDLDRTRNDLGPYGGPWPIDQFDAQRDPAYQGPFIYPLFEANANLQDSNTLRVRALTVARLR